MQKRFLHCTKVTSVTSASLTDGRDVLYLNYVGYKVSSISPITVKHARSAMAQQI
jgi:hypothetical protein